MDLSELLGFIKNYVPIMKVELNSVMEDTVLY